MEKLENIINGNIIEYNYLGNLLYEGEYKNGKRWNGKMYNNNEDLELVLKKGNGNGKEYDFLSNLNYEGNYINGNREGIGKEFNDNKMIFEGHYVDDEKNGEGKEYNKLGKLIFKGKYRNGKIDEGTIMEYYKNQLLFKAEYVKYWNEHENITIIDSNKYFNNTSKEYQIKKLK